MQQKLLIVLGIVLSFGMGIFTGAKILPMESQEEVSAKCMINQSAALKALEESAASKFASNSGVKIKQDDGIKFLTGSVQSISGDEVSVKISTLPELMTTPDLITRVVKIDSSTKILQMIQKDFAKIQDEQKAYQEKMSQQDIKDGANPKDLPTPPQGFDTVDAKFSDLKVGQIIIVTAVDDITTKKQFIASSIAFQGVSDNK